MMMDGIGGMMGGMGLLWLLVAVPLVLGIAALVKIPRRLVRLVTPRARAAAIIAAAAVTAGALALALRERSAASASAERLETGHEAYAAHCASCHGKDLEGQPDWKRRLPSGRMPAPPHDASGHTRHHPDGVLFRITTEGPAAVGGGGYEGDMPVSAKSSLTMKSAPSSNPSKAHGRSVSAGTRPS
jgi:cytochrome c5